MPEKQFVKSFQNTPSASNSNIRPRQPLLWAAFAFGAGIIVGAYLWRPAVWWLVAGTYFIFAGIYYLRHRVWAASALGLGTFVAAGIFSIQVRPSTDIGDSSIFQFTDGREVILTAHVIKEGINRPE